MPTQCLSSMRQLSVLDPRTKLLTLITLTTVLLTGGYSGIMPVVRPVLAALPFVLLLLSHKAFAAWGYASIVAIAALVQSVIQVYVSPSGFVATLALLMCGFVLRLAPGIAAGYYLVTTTTVNEFVAGLERMHIPQAFIIPLSVMFRFIPTLNEEATAINRAVRMRGVGARRPFSAIEYRLVPLMMCSIRIGDELSASALTRGLGAPCQRSSISSIGFHLFDAAVAMICVVCMAAFCLQGMGVI